MLSTGGGENLMAGGDGADTLTGGAADDFLIGSNVFNRELTADDYNAIRNDDLPFDDDDTTFFPGFGFSGTDTDTAADTLFGGIGDDFLLLGNNDIATGGVEDDAFIIGDWITDGNAAVVTDFDSTEDIIVVQLSDANSDAEVTAMMDGDVGVVLINGAEVARINGTFDSADGIDADVVTAIYTPL